MSERGRSRLFGRPSELLVEEAPPRILMPAPPPRSPTLDEITEDTRNDLDGDEEPSLSSGPLRVFVGPPSPRLAARPPGAGGEIDGDALGELGSVLGRRVPAPRGARASSSDPNRTDLPDMDVRPMGPGGFDDGLRTELPEMDLAPLAAPDEPSSPTTRAPIERVALPGPERGRAAGLPTAAARGLPTAAARGLPTAAARGGARSPVEIEDEEATRIDAMPLPFDDRPRGLDLRPGAGGVKSPDAPSWDDPRFSKPDAPTDAVRPVPDERSGAAWPGSVEASTPANPPGGALRAGASASQEANRAPVTGRAAGGAREEGLSAPVAAELPAAPGRPAAAPPKAAASRRTLAAVLAAAVVFGVGAWLVGQRFGAAPERPRPRAAQAGPVEGPAARAGAPVGAVAAGADEAAGAGAPVGAPRGEAAASVDGGASGARSDGASPAAATTTAPGVGTAVAEGAGASPDGAVAPGAVVAGPGPADGTGVGDTRGQGVGTAAPGGAAEAAPDGSAAGAARGGSAAGGTARPTAASGAAGPTAASGTTVTSAAPAAADKVEPPRNPTAGRASGWRWATPEELAADAARRAAAAKAPPKTSPATPTRVDAPKAPATPVSGTSNAAVAAAIATDRRGGYQVPTGLLQVVCNAKATIYVDDKRVGSTTDAKPIELPAGTHRVRVVSSRGSRTQEVRVDPGQLRLVEFRLR